MLSISHSATGAFIASKLPHPLLYIPLTLAAHYLEDWIPHWDVGTGLSNGSRKKNTAFVLEWIDLIVSVGFIYWLWQAGSSEIQSHIWAGALTGLMPDFVEFPRNFLHWEPFFFKPFNSFHGFFHHSTPNLWIGLGTQVVVLGLIIGLTLWSI